MLRAAVERQFEIIGDAFVGLRRVDPALAAGIRIYRGLSPFVKY